MASSKITGLTALTSPAADDLLAIVDVSASQTKKITVAAVGGYVLVASTANNSPADASTLYFGCLFTETLSGAQVRRIHIPRTGTITACSVFFRNVSVGTSISSTLSIRLNDTSDTTVSSVINNSTATQGIVTTGLSIAVTTSDYIEMKWVTPTWASNPTGVYITAYILVS